MQTDESLVTEVQIPRLFVVGSASRVGTSSIVLGLIVSLTNSGSAVSAAKLGVSLIETTHFRRVLGRLSYSFDPWILDNSGIQDGIIRSASGSDIVIIEGQGSLFDSLGADVQISSQAKFALATGTPIILVIDASNINHGISALLHGFNSYMAGVQIAGVIANRIADEKHNRIIRSSIESLAGPSYLGGVKIDPDISSEAVQLNNPSLLPRNKIIRFAQIVNSALDLPRIRSIAKHSQPFSTRKYQLGTRTRCRIAVTDDQAFHLTIQDNLDLLRKNGAELVAFSPIADRKLPSDVKAVYFTGGYPNLYAPDLHANSPMRNAIQEFVAAGGLLYAEGSAIAYLCKSLRQFNGNQIEMVGVLPGMATALIEDSFAEETIFEEVSVLRDCFIAKRDMVVRGFRLSRWAIRFEYSIDGVFKLSSRSEQKQYNPVPVIDGFMTRENVLATRLYLHWGSNPKFAQNFVDAVEKL